MALMALHCGSLFMSLSLVVGVFLQGVCLTSHCSPGQCVEPDTQEALHKGLVNTHDGLLIGPVLFFPSSLPPSSPLDTRLSIYSP